MRLLPVPIALINVAHVVRVTGWDADRGGESLNPLAIHVMAVFSLFTVPLWPTYAPSMLPFRKANAG